MTAVEVTNGAAAPLRAPAATSTPPAEPVETNQPEGDEAEDDDDDETPAAGTGALKTAYHCRAHADSALLYHRQEEE